MYLEETIPEEMLTEKKITKWGCVVKMVEEEDPELTSFHRHTKIKVIYRATIYEKT